MRLLLGGAYFWGGAYYRSLISSLQQMRLLLGGAYYRKFTVYMHTYTYIHTYIHTYEYILYMYNKLTIKQMHIKKLPYLSKKK